MLEHVEIKLREIFLREFNRKYVSAADSQYCKRCERRWPDAFRQIWSEVRREVYAGAKPVKLPLRMINEDLLFKD